MGIENLPSSDDDHAAAQDGPPLPPSGSFGPPPPGAGPSSPPPPPGSGASFPPPPMAPSAPPTPQAGASVTAKKKKGKGHIGGSGRGRLPPSQSDTDARPGQDVVRTALGSGRQIDVKAMHDEWRDKMMRKMQDVQNMHDIQKTRTGNGGNRARNGRNAEDTMELPGMPNIPRMPRMPRMPRIPNINTSGVPGGGGVVINESRRREARGRAMDVFNRGRTSAHQNRNPFPVPDGFKQRYNHHHGRQGLPPDSATEYDK